MPGWIKIPRFEYVKIMESADYQPTAGGRLLHEGYFTEWERPSGGHCDLRYEFQGKRERFYKMFDRLLVG
jgi:hypothetical protein